jgi:hypothetical protein
VQQVRQAALAAAGAQQLGRQAQFVDEAAQHRQHALALPGLVQALQLLDPLFPGQFVARQAGQFGQRQRAGGGGEGGARQPPSSGLATACSQRSTSTASWLSTTESWSDR